MSILAVLLGCVVSGWVVRSRSVRRIAQNTDGSDSVRVTGGSANVGSVTRQGASARASSRREMVTLYNVNGAHCILSGWEGLVC